MNISNYLRNIKEVRDEELSEKFYEMLSDIFSIKKKLCTGIYLFNLNKNNKDLVKQHIKKDDGFCKLVIEFHNRTYPIIKRSEQINEPLILLNYCAMLTMIYDFYPSAFNVNENNKIKYVLVKMLQSLLNKFLQLVDNQSSALFKISCETVNYIKSLCLKNNNIFLIESPIGNSIPVQILQYLFNINQIKFETINILLSRNDAKTKGISRQELIKNQFDKINFQKNDLILYIDEWFTGTNFNLICNFVCNCLNNINSSLLFLPIGLLGEESEKQSKYKEYSIDHDKILENLGLNGNDFRKIIPKLAGEFVYGDTFYWSEYDRLSGYRKMQLLGSLFSTIDSYIELMKNDDSLLFKVKNEFLIEISQTKTISEKILYDFYNLKIFFDESYNDYQSCKSKIIEIEHSSNLGEVYDIDDSILEVSEKIDKIFEHKKGKFCVYLATLLMLKSSSYSAKNRYFFRHHVPITLKLEDDTKILNEEFIKAMINKYTSLISQQIIY